MVIQKLWWRWCCEITVLPRFGFWCKFTTVHTQTWGGWFSRQPCERALRWWRGQWDRSRRARQRRDATGPQTGSRAQTRPPCWEESTTKNNTTIIVITPHKTACYRKGKFLLWWWQHLDFLWPCFCRSVSDVLDFFLAQMWQLLSHQHIRKSQCSDGEFCWMSRLFLSPFNCFAKLS